MTSKQFHLHHASIMVADTRQSLDFYCGVLGMNQIDRPDLPFPGAWLEVGPFQQIHLLELPNPDADTARPEHGGRDRHFAMIVPDLDCMKDRIEECVYPLLGQQIRTQSAVLQRPGQ